MLTIIHGDSLEELRKLPAESVHCCVTSPPYWGLRDYGVAGQIGLEPTFEEFLTKLVAVFDEVRRVLRADGTCWVNMGDSYASAGGTGHQGKHGDRCNRTHTQRNLLGNVSKSSGLKSKDILGQPWALAFALRNSGWYLRQDIIWHKPNPMPESVTDRCTKSHEYIFLLSKSERYFYDQESIREAVTGGSHARGSGVNKKIKAPDGWETGESSHGTIHRNGREKGETRPKQNASFSSAVKDLVDDRNKRSVWTVPTFAYSEAHFATYPPALIRPCILAGCPVGGVVLDPFCGSGTTGQVAIEEGRSAILIDLNPANIPLIKRRTNVTPGLGL